MRLPRRDKLPIGQDDARSWPTPAPGTPTTSNPLSDEWAIDDEIIRLREWASTRVHSLYSDDRGLHRIGSGPGCEIRIRDPRRRISRQHAYIERQRGRWVVCDDHSKNGLVVDGVLRDKAGLVPGTEIGLGGGATLVAESARLIAVRNGLARLLGWSARQAEPVDLALRTVRLAATRRAVLVLCGEQDLDLAPLAAELHRLTLTAARPFVICHPGRQHGEAFDLPFQHAPTGRQALAEAWTGTVCLYQKHLPADLMPLWTQLRRPDCPAQLVVLAEDAELATVFNPSPIIVPPLASRQDEIDRLIDEYADQAAATLAMRVRLSPGEREWIRAWAAGSLADIQRATLRLAAMHQGGSVAAGASRVGISHTALTKWLRKREFPRELLDSWTLEDL